MKKRLMMGLLAALILFSGPAEATVILTVNPSGIITSSCYTKADAEAEQAIRLRSILMVIGLNCQASRYNGTTDNLYNVYRQFVFDHGPQFASYEKQMLDYFARTGSADLESDLNGMETSFGNVFSLDVAQMRPDMFCYQYSKSLLKVRSMDADQFRAWALTPDEKHPHLHPMCPQQQ